MAEHVPVLLAETLSALQPRCGGQYLDGTLGGGGHAEAILERSSPDGRLLGLDIDADAIEIARRRLQPYEGRCVLVQANFGDLAAVARQNGFDPVDGVLLDLGFSSDQISAPERGFSFELEGPLDMRLDRSQPTTAYDLVNDLSEHELADLLWRYGEERRSRAIARAIASERKRGPIGTTWQLADIVRRVVPRRGAPIDPATRTCQALRIAVNRELENLAQGLARALDVLRPGAGLAVISFHSLEDRIVKQFFTREARDCLCPPQLPVCVCGHKARLKVVTPKPIVPSAREVAANPRSRSAKLRVAMVL